MAVLKLLTVLCLLTLSLATSLPSAVTHQKKAKCSKLSLDVSADRIACAKKKFKSEISVLVDLPPASASLLVTTPCVKKGKNKRLSRRIVKCIRLFLKRCKCLRDERKDFCIINQVDTCAGRGVVVPLVTPGP